MPADAWVALVLGVVSIIGAILVAGWRVSGQIGATIAKFEVIDTARSTDIHRLNVAVEKIEVAVSAIAVDRERATAVERRVAILERWYDELRRGIGRITPPHEMS